MANNRMWLVHSSGEKILLAKYYPGTNWYIYHEEEKLNIFFENTGKLTLFGSTDYKLEFEIEE